MTDDGFINEYQKRHYEECKREVEYFRKHPMLPGEGKLRSEWLHEQRLQGKKQSFLDWVVKREPDKSDIWKRTLAERESGLKAWMKG